jgi:hypothetical protein
MSSMPILSALYYKDNEFIQELTRTGIDYQSYQSTYKGNLYCPTKGCSARVVFVSGQRNYFKTWQKDDHIDNCLYKFDRLTGRPSVLTSGNINVTIPEDRIRRSLREAYLESTLSDQELENRRQRRIERRRNNPVTRGRQIRPRVNPAADGSQVDGDATTLGIRPPNLLKRDVDAFREKDIGMTRVIRRCIISHVSFTLESATIVVVKGNTQIEVKFGEAFRANSPNALSLFHHIERYVREESPVRFTAMGQVRLSQSGAYEFAVFGEDRFLIEKRSLLQLAAFYAANQ